MHSVVLFEVPIGLPVLEALVHLAEVAAGSKTSNSVDAAALSIDLSVLTALKSTKLPSEAAPSDSRTHTTEEAD